MLNHHSVIHLIVSLTLTLLQCSFNPQLRVWLDGLKWLPWCWNYMNKFCLFNKTKSFFLSVHSPSSLNGRAFVTWEQWTGFCDLGAMEIWKSMHIYQTLEKCCYIKCTTREFPFASFVRYLYCFQVTKV